MAKFFNSTSHSSDQLRLKFLVTSRPYHTIERRIQRPLTIRLRIEDESNLVSEDVKLVVEKRIEDFSHRKQISDDLKRTLTDQILSMSDQTFLWASLVLDDLEQSLRTSPKSLLSLIDRRPRDLDEIYEKILNRTEDRQATTRILHIVIGAARPLSLKEMNIALLIKPDIREYCNLDLEPAESIENTIRELGGLFIKVIDSRIYLIHQTAREFLIKTNQPISNEPGLWKHSFDSIETECIPTEICINYLMFKDFDVDDLSYSNQSDCQGSNEKYRFLEYTTKNWASHFREAQSEASNRLIKSVESIYNVKSVRFDIWLRNYGFWMKKRPLLTELTAASVFGHELIVRLLLEKGADIEAKDNSGKTALYWAARNGHETVVRLLLEEGADFKAKDDEGGIALHWAVVGDDDETITKLLLERGADTEAKDNNRETALHWATWHGHEAIAKLLLENGADIKAKDKYGRTVLHWAARNGIEGAVKILLDKGADTEAKAGDGTTALYVAVKNGHEAVIKLLLEKGADTEAKDDNGNTALHWAEVRGGDEVITKLLLENGADIEAKDNDG
ncbi:MAG: hypothetical protein M1814_001167 [Vezdaea aestivalis]|nr:MAG: hypothetical protein M1814_001167 [Vezdaea aestivalis]